MTILTADSGLFLDTVQAISSDEKSFYSIPAKVWKEFGLVSEMSMYVEFEQDYDSGWVSIIDVSVRNNDEKELASGDSDNSNLQKIGRILNLVGEDVVSLSFGVDIPSHFGDADNSADDEAEQICGADCELALSNIEHFSGYVVSNGSLDYRKNSVIVLKRKHKRAEGLVKGAEYLDNWPSAETSKYASRNKDCGIGLLRVI